MRASSVHGLIAGVAAERPLAEVPELEAVGEETAPRRRHMPWHQHDCWELYVQISGTVTRASRQATVELSPGQAYLAAPHAPHRVVNRGSATQHNVYARFALPPVVARHPGLAALWRVRGCARLEQAGALIDPAERLLREVATDQSLRPTGVRIALDGLVIAAARVIAGAPARILAPLPPALERARQLLAENCGEAWSLNRLAAAASLSPSHLGALFRRHCGMPPHRYLLARRMERARHLLAYTDLTIGDIAAQLGFLTSQHFATCFRAHVATSARAYRAEAQRHGSRPAASASAAGPEGQTESH